MLPAVFVFVVLGLAVCFWVFKDPPDDDWKNP